MTGKAAALTSAFLWKNITEGEKSGEDFWIKAERLYYTALIGYIYYEAPIEWKLNL